VFCFIVQSTEDKLTDARALLVELEAQHMAETAATKKSDEDRVNRIIGASEKQHVQPSEIAVQDLTGLSQYEIDRLSRIARNKAHLIKLNLETSNSFMKKPAAPRSKPRGKPKTVVPTRRPSSRNSGKQTGWFICRIYIYIYIYIYILVLCPVCEDRHIYGGGGSGVDYCLSCSTRL